MANAMTPLRLNLAAFRPFPHRATDKARSIVLDIIKASDTPLATKDIYKLAARPTRPNDKPPHVDQEIRSMRYLKKVVLEDLASQNRVEKVRIKEPFSAWVWKAKQVPSPETIRSVEPPAPSSATKLTPAVVGAGEDWSHLNKRRRIARLHAFERNWKRVKEVTRRGKQAAKEYMAAVKS